MNSVIYPVRGELQQVQESMKRHFYIKAGYLGGFAHLDLCQLNNVLRPLLVVLSARTGGKITDKVISLAGVLQYIYLASRVHGGINEDNAIAGSGTDDPRDGCQFPVLVGDYFYGRFFTTLCDAGIVEYLGPLSEIICEINEGAVIRLKNADDEKRNPLLYRELVRKETAELIAGCCRLGGRLGGADEQQQKILYRFGINLGLALGLLEQGNNYEQVGGYLREAAVELERLPQRQGLKDLVELFLRREIPLRRMVG